MLSPLDMTIQAEIDYSQDQSLVFTSKQGTTDATWSARDNAWTVHQYKWVDPTTVVQLHGATYSKQDFQGLVSSGGLGDQTDPQTARGLRSSIYSQGMPETSGDGTLKIVDRK